MGRPVGGRAHAKGTGPAAARLRIRRARAADIPALEALYRQLNLSGYRDVSVPMGEMRRAFARLRGNRDHTILLVERAGKVVGAAHVIIVPHLGHGLSPMAIVENVVVDAAARSEGLGEHLMRAATDVARRRRCYKLALTTNIARMRSHHFYERLGWKRTHFGYSFPLRER